MKSCSSYSSSNTDRALDFSSSTGSSVYTHCSSLRSQTSGRDTDIRGNKVPKGSTRRLSREELIARIKDVVTGINKQEKYLKHQAEKQQRNKQLIDHLTSLTENDRKDTEHKKKECERVEKERIRYEETIQKYRKDVQHSSARFVMAQRLNVDLTKQKKMLEKKRDWLRRQEKERGVDEEAINEYVNAQRLLTREQEKKENLAKKIAWYEKEIAKAKQERDNKKLGVIAKAGDSLPDIEIKPRNLVSERVEDTAVVTNIMDVIERKDGYVDELHGTQFVPRPPELPRSDNGTANRFRRKFRPRN